MNKIYKVRDLEIDGKTVQEMRKSIIRFLKTAKINDDSVYIIWCIWDFIGKETALNKLLPIEILKKIGRK